MRDIRFGRRVDEVGAQRLSGLDAQGIDEEALSINPTWYGAERDLAERVVGGRVRAAGDHHSE
jgi:hypothetical protein